MRVCTIKIYQRFLTNLCEGNMTLHLLMNISAKDSKFLRDRVSRMRDRETRLKLSRRIERDFHSRRDVNSRSIDSIGGRLADREQIE